MDPLLDFAPCGFLSVADDGHVEAANATLAAMLHTSASALVDRHIDQLFRPPSRIYYQTHVFPILKLQGRIEEVYVSLQDATGGEVPVLLNAARTERQGHFVSDWVVVPMRRRNEYENAILKARNLAEDAVRSKDEFLAVVSHELRAPLSAISGWAQVLDGLGLDEATVQQAALVIERNVRHQAKLIDDILDLTRIGSGKLRVELAPLDLLA
ncbi:MAG: histidine kinase dimerization/phospho-acceptor domain-containing protein, partial [Betaproteobacteria bacterium]